MNSESTAENSSEDDEGTASKSAELRIQPVPFHQISNGADEIWIEFEQQLYRLRITRNRKLILTK
jgi:hemin uptake protein HemP